MPSATVNSPRSLGRVKLLSSDDENILDTFHTQCAVTLTRFTAYFDNYIDLSCLKYIYSKDTDDFPQIIENITKLHNFIVAIAS